MKTEIKYGVEAMIIVTLIYATYAATSVPGEYDNFADCLTENGIIMYGTNWCSHCNSQKDLFGKSFSNIDFKDCDSVKDECVQAGVNAYPTWKINGENVVGEQSLEKLALLSGCKLEEQL